MKIRLFLFCCLCSIWAAGQTDALGGSKYENTYEVTFEDGYTEYVTISDNPANIVPNFVDWSLLRFAGYGGGGESGAWGPFIASTSYARLMDDNNQFIQTDFMFAIVDVAKFEYYRGERRMNRIYIEGFYNYALFDWEKTKAKDINFYNPERQTGDANTITIHKAKLPFAIERQLAVRGGLMYVQRTIYNSDIDTLLPDNFDENDGIISNIYGTRSVVVGVGITLNKIINLGYDSEGFGTKQSHYFGNSYIDILFAPVTSTYEAKRARNDETSSFDEFEHGKVDDAVDLDINTIGFRIGFSKKASLIRASKFGQTMGVEGGMLPGLASGGGYFLINYGLSWGF